MTSVRSTGWYAVVAVCLLVTAGCGDSHEAITLDTISTLQEYAQVLESVQDDASAESAVPRVTAIGEQLAALKRRSERMGEAPKEIRDRIQDKYSKNLESARLAVRRTYEKMDPKYAEQLTEAVQGVELSVVK